jgi:L-rhamnose isomerase/sugar isomerase
VCAFSKHRDRLTEYQQDNDALMATTTLKNAFRTDVEPILAMARQDAGGAVDPLATYRVAG